MYQARSACRSEFVPIRGWQYHLRTWGQPEPGRPALVLAHGWMDVAASWQFMVDALRQQRWIIAPDWRGFGQTTCEGPGPDSFWFPDYLGDLDALLDHFSPDAPVDLVGHSMGGNVAMMYAGARPQRIRRLVNLEGFGLPGTQPQQAPGRYAKWLDGIRAQRHGELEMATYEDADGVARRLMKTNPRLDGDKAGWLARHWARPGSDGRWAIMGASSHKVVSASLYQVEEALALYRRIAAPTLFVKASGDSLTPWWKGALTLAEFQERIRQVPDVRLVDLPDCGHMLHHDQPEALARLIEDFLDEGR